MILSVKSIQSQKVEKIFSKQQYLFSFTQFVKKTVHYYYLHI